MHLDSRLKALAATISLVGLLAVLAAGGPASAAPGANASACTVSKNVEAIIDDSGSMSASDPETGNPSQPNFRAGLLDAYVGLGGNQGKTLGAVKFSTDATSLFTPTVINQQTRLAMQGQFNTQLVDSGGTNYDAGFTLGNSENPSATSRIFLSDGAPGQDSDLHRTPPTKTYVIGLGVGSDASAVQELTQIATETGGPPPQFIENAGQLQAAAGVITADQNCKPLLQFVDSFVRSGQAFAHKFKAKGKSADILTSWPTIGDVIDLVLRGGGKKASVSKVKVQKTRGATFVSVHVKGLRKGTKVKLKVKATTLPVPTTATTQVIR